MTSSLFAFYAKKPPLPIDNYITLLIVLRANFIYSSVFDPCPVPTDGFQAFV